MECAPKFTPYNTFIALCFTVIFILSLLGNSAVVFAITKHQRRTARSITNVFLLNLAIADLLRSVICIPPTLMSEISRCWLLGPHVCKLAAYLQPVAVCASAYTLAVIALERYYAICRPLESRSWLSRVCLLCPVRVLLQRRSLVLILIVWLIAFVGNIGTLVIYDAVPYKSHWSCHSKATPLADFFYQIHVTLLLLLIPLTVMLCLYYKVIKTLHSDSQPDMESTFCYECMECNQGYVEHKISFASWLYTSLVDQNTKSPSVPPDAHTQDPKRRETRASMQCNEPNRLACNHYPRSRSIANGSPAPFKTLINGKMSGSYDCGYMLRSNHQEKIIEAKRRVTRMLIIIVIAFVMCWTPSFIWWLAIRTSDLVRIRLWNSSANTFITLLTYISTCTNPITYCFMNERFRQNVFMHLWCCPFQACQQSSRSKLASNVCTLQRPNFIDPYNGDLFVRASNMEQAVAAIPLISDDS